MSQEIDLRKIELKTYLAYHQDGIWDLVIGLALIGMALDMRWGVPGTSFIIIIVAIILVPALRKAFTLPRLGYVKFSPERESKEKRNTTALLALFTLTAALGLVVFYGYTGNADWQHSIRNLGVLPFGFVLTMVSLALGFLYRITRCLLYAPLVMAAFLATHFLELHPFVHFLFIGLILSATGTVMLVKFIHRYPRVTPGDSGNV